VVFTTLDLMQLIENNPYRVLGVKANATLSDRKQQANLIAQYLKIGQSAKLDFDITPPLSPIKRTKEMMDLQGSRIHSTEDQIVHSLFWFVEANGIDKIALKHLTGSKDIDKALSDFEKGCRGFIVGSDSYSAILNHSTLEIIAFQDHKDLTKLKSAIAQKFSIVSDSDSLGHLKKLVASDGMNTSVQRILELSMPKLKEMLSELVPSKNADKLLLEIFKSNTVIYPGLRNEVIESKISLVQQLVVDAEQKREANLNGSGGFKQSCLMDVPALGQLLLNEVDRPLKELKKLLGKKDPVFIDALEKIYSEVNYCCVLPFNKLIEQVNNSPHLDLMQSADLSSITSLYQRAIGDLGTIDLPIRETIIRNFKGISESGKAKTCKFCNSSEVDVSRKLKIPMHKMTGLGTFRHFKDGGFGVSSCASCSGRINGKGIIAFIVALLVYGGIALLTSGVSIGIDFFTGFSIVRWWFSFMKKQIYYKEVGKHPDILELIQDGYEFGMPRGA